MSTYAEDLSPVRGTHVNLIALPFVFTPNGASAPVLVTTGGVSRSFASVSRISAGLFQLTLKNKWASYRGIYVSLGLNAAADYTVQEVRSANTVTSVSPTASTGGVVQIVFQTAAVATDIAANASNVISGFVLVSDVKGKY